MQSKFIILLITICFLTFYSCADRDETAKSTIKEKPIAKTNKQGLITNKTEKKNINKNKEEIKNSISVDGCKYEQRMAHQGLVNITNIDPTILVELKYSTSDNFVGKDVYDCLSTCYLQKKAAHMLKTASDFLKNENDSLRLLVYDGARPHSIQIILWESLPHFSPEKRKTYVADPAIGSIHNYGSAVDLTITKIDGNPLDMGTKYDFFGELAYPKLEDKFFREGKLSKIQIENRQLLRKVMKKAGFTSIEYEWWHFNAVSRAKAKSLYQIIQ